MATFDSLSQEDQSKKIEEISKLLQDNELNGIKIEVIQQLVTDITTGAV